MFIPRAQPGRATGYVDNVSDEQVVDLLKTAEAANYFLASKLTGSCRHLQVFLCFDMPGDEYMRFITRIALRGGRPRVTRTIFFNARYYKSYSRAVAALQQPRPWANPEKSLRKGSLVPRAGTKVSLHKCED